MEKFFKIDLDTSKIYPAVPKLDGENKLRIQFKSTKKVVSLFGKVITIMLRNRFEKVVELNNKEWKGSIIVESKDTISVTIPEEFTKINGIINFDLKVMQDGYEEEKYEVKYNFMVANIVKTKLDEEISASGDYEVIKQIIKDITEIGENIKVDVENGIAEVRHAAEEILSHYQDLISDLTDEKLIAITESAHEKDLGLIETYEAGVDAINSAKDGLIEEITEHSDSKTEELTAHTEDKKQEIDDLVIEEKEQIKEFVQNKVEEIGFAFIDEYIEEKIKGDVEEHKEGIKVQLSDFSEDEIKPELAKYTEEDIRVRIDNYGSAQEERLLELINSHAVQGNLVFDTYEEMVQYVLDNEEFEEKVFVGLTCFVIEELMNYYYKGNNRWGKFHSSATVHIGTEPPEDETMVWINPEDEDVDASIDGDILEEFRTTITQVREKVNDLDYSINKKIDPGIFDPPIPDEDGNETPWPKTVETVTIKRGAKRFLPELKDGEMAFTKDTGELFIGNDGKVVNLSAGGNSGNFTSEYFDLISPDNTKFRVTINNSGKFVVYRAELDDAEDPKPSEASRFIGLIINQIYGAGSASDAPVSNDFIELYNKTSQAINLKGLSLQCAANGEPWQVLELKGEILPYHSYLIRCGANKYSTSMKHNISDYDVDWNVKISDKGAKVYLCVGRDICPVRNPFNADGAGNKHVGYIDLIGAAGIDKTRTIDAYEKTMKHIMDKKTSARRHDFNDTDDHRVDIKGIDFSDDDNKIYLPRSSSDGKWDIYFDKEQLNPDKPNMISMTFAKEADTGRCFTWQSTNSSEGWLYYANKEEVYGGKGVEMIGVPSSITNVQHTDSDATIHSVILKNLEPGNYVYRCGFKSESDEMKWSPLYDFEVKLYTNEDNIRILHTTDQQSWDEHEYKCWEIANKFLEKEVPNHTYDFRMNTGDISQNANRSFEWRYYFKFAENTLATKPEVTTVGNNDLIDKLYTEAWNYYYTYEDSPLPSVYSFDIGYCHFVSLDSWVGLAHHFQEIPAPTPENPDATKKVDMHLQKQLEWLDNDLANTDKRWKIVYMHLSPYTISVNAKQRPFAEIFEKHGVHLVICGHNHCYSRSLPLKGFDTEAVFNGKAGVPIVNEEEGTYYVLCQGTGYKLEGKDVPKPNTPWIPYGEDTDGGVNPKNPCWTPDQPSYIIWDISYDEINMKSYMMKGLKANIPALEGTEKEYNSFESINAHLYDTLTITHR